MLIVVWAQRITNGNALRAALYFVDYKINHKFRAKSARIDIAL